MKDTENKDIINKLEKLNVFFQSHQTKDIKFRIHQLKNFKQGIKKFEKKITDALWQDLHKSYEESYITEISMVIQEIDNHIKHLKKWAKPKRVPTPIYILPSKSKIIYEPLGVSLIIAPWNYPFNLQMMPLVGAISAGCCAMLKTPPYTPNVSQSMSELIEDTFNENYINTIQGGREVNQSVLEQKFDIIFFTGSPFLGKIVMKSASQYLTPVVLELGGKSPCIVDKDANIKIAAKRIAWGKCLNAGQTCIAPDYLFVHQSVKNKLFTEIKKAIKAMFGEDVKQSKYFPRIVNESAFDRLSGLMKQGDIVLGGNTDKSEKYIEPTIIDNVQADFDIMQEEIFGPLLPALSFEKIEEVYDYVNKNDKPLAFYYFGTSKKAKEVLYKTTSGGGCVNDTIMHVANHHLPFGGVGNSGMGKYHGKESFLVFSNHRSIISSPTYIELPVKAAPHKYFKWVKKIL